MTEVVAESENADEAKEQCKVWLEHHPEYAKTLTPSDFTLDVIRAEDRTVYRYRVNLPSR